MGNARNMEYHVNLLGGVSGVSNPGGRTFYVAASGWTAIPDGIPPASTNNGLTPQQPLDTIQGALNKCLTGRGDIVAVLPGSYTITAAITMTKDDVTLCSAYPVGPQQRGPAVIVNATDVNMLEINANNCVVEGLVFDDNVAAGTDNTGAIFVNSASTGVDYTGTIIRNCYFDAVGADATDRDGVTLGFDADDGALGSLVEGCTFEDVGGDAVKINVGSEYSEVRNCRVYDIADQTIYGVEVLATSCHVQGCDIYITTTGGACIHNGVAAARLTVTDCNLHAYGANTTGILAIDTATQRTANNFITATAAGNIVDYLTASTSPSADVNVMHIFAANVAACAFDTPTVAGS